MERFPLDPGGGLEAVDQDLVRCGEYSQVG